MAARAYWYYVPYEENYIAALEKLRQREFIAGRYNTAIPYPQFPVTEFSETPGAQHATIEEALEESEPDGTRSILDLYSVSEVGDYCVAKILSNEELFNYFGTEKPTKELIENVQNFFDDIERGTGLCIPVFENEVPKELFFAGYSFD